jgi:DnaJ-class molecular chaperone
VHPNGELEAAPVDARLPDYYSTLGLHRSCTLAQIRNAYRVLAKQHHPDLNGATAEASIRTRELNEAHDTLSDPGRRRAYDQALDDNSRNRPAAHRARIERNISHDVHLRIDELLSGAVLDVQITDPANPEGSESYQVEVPPETAPGTRFRLPRAGPFTGGWVHVRVRLRPSARFKARGSDLRCELRINSRRAAQGGTETLVGASGRPIFVKIAANIGRGEIIRVAGEGLPKPRGGRGDLLVKITYRPEVRVTSRARHW